MSAGSICQDRATGKLAQLLATDLSDTEIVLGKLAARLVPVTGLVCCALTALALSVLLGGGDPLALTGAFFITMSLAVFGCTSALTFSVWALKPYEVLLATYAVFTVWLLAVPVWDFLAFCWRYPSSPDRATQINPFYLAFAPYVQPGKVSLLSFLSFFRAILVMSAALAALAIKRIRGVIVAQAGNPVLRSPAREVPAGFSSTRMFGTGQAPSLDGNPILWYEAHRKQPSFWVRTMIRAYFVLAVVFSLLAIEDSMQQGSVIPGLLSAYVVAFQFHFTTSSSIGRSCRTKRQRPPFCSHVL